jgi:hypothetical protein
MTVAESKGLKKDSRVYWPRGNTRRFLRPVLGGDAAAERIPAPGRGGLVHLAGAAANWTDMWRQAADWGR